MRKIVEEGSCQTWVIAYDVPFRGRLGSAHGYCSGGASLDEEDGGGDENEDGFFCPVLPLDSAWKLRQPWRVYCGRSAGELEPKKKTKKTKKKKKSDEEKGRGPKPRRQGDEQEVEMRISGSESDKESLPPVSSRKHELEDSSDEALEIKHRGDEKEEHSDRDRQWKGLARRAPLSKKKGNAVINPQLHDSSDEGLEIKHGEDEKEEHSDRDRQRKGLTRRAPLSKKKGNAVINLQLHNSSDEGLEMKHKEEEKEEHLDRDRQRKGLIHRAPLSKKKGNVVINSQLQDSSDEDFEMKHKEEEEEHLDSDRQLKSLIRRAPLSKKKGNAIINSQLQDSSDEGFEMKHKEEEEEEHLDRDRQRKNLISRAPLSKKKGNAIINSQDSSDEGFEMKLKEEEDEEKHLNRNRQRKSLISRGSLSKKKGNTIINSQDSLDEGFEMKLKEEKEEEQLDRDRQQKSLIGRAPLSKKKGNAIINSQVQKTHAAASTEVRKTKKKLVSDSIQKERETEVPEERGTKVFSRKDSSQVVMEDLGAAPLHKKLRKGVHDFEQTGKKRKLKSSGESIDANDESWKRKDVEGDNKMLCKAEMDDTVGKTSGAVIKNNEVETLKDHSSTKTGVVSQSPETVKDNCGSLGSGHSVIDQHAATAATKDIDNGVIGEEVSSGLMEGLYGDNKTHEDSQKKVGKTAPNVGWVLCDDCEKWRCIPSELADAVGAANRRWTCVENPNKSFACCSIPQEKSNEQINAELNISEVSFCEDGDDNHPPVESKSIEAKKKQDRQPSMWTLTKHNVFHHRQRKSLKLDEIMVCQCRPLEYGGVGCGEECLNRMLSIECVPGTCPCGDLCSNQQFQRRNYAKVNSVRCGKKGFGLRIQEDVPKGTFIIEYVGEVLDMQSHEARQKQYASRGQKHSYFMTLNANEVIDACTKGNLGRFVNHSCEPNCVTEKWMVDGEVCIGLFAIHNIKKGDEITCDYNIVRMCGISAKKCYCGSVVCKGIIGGDPLNPLGGVESESDEEDELEPEPIMLKECRQDEGVSDHLDMREGRKQSITSEDNAGEKSKLGMKRKIAGAQLFNKQENTSKRLKPSLMSRRLPTAKGLTTETVGGRFEGVEEKLNEILDNQGGICKRKDAARHYLKLLVVTAACGDTISEEASRSTRDLSMVLDALMKTISRSILVDIIHKNGLQILHNMIKQNWKNYKRTPIIRKILKVLEFLAERHILTPKQINAKPLPFGVESFRDTMFKLSRHGDTEVQNIAWRFREKWMNNGNEKSVITLGSRHKDYDRFTFHSHSFAEERKPVAKHDRGKDLATEECKPVPQCEKGKDLTTEERKPVPQREKGKDLAERPSYYEPSVHANSEARENRPRRKSRWDEEGKPSLGDGHLVSNHNLQVDEAKLLKTASEVVEQNIQSTSNDVVGGISQSQSLYPTIEANPRDESCFQERIFHQQSEIAHAGPNPQWPGSVPLMSSQQQLPTMMIQDHGSQIGVGNPLWLQQIQSVGLPFGAIEQLGETSITLGIPQDQFIQAMLSTTVPSWPMHSADTSQSWGQPVLTNPDMPASGNTVSAVANPLFMPTSYESVNMGLEHAVAQPVGQQNFHNPIAVSQQKPPAAQVENADLTGHINRSSRFDVQNPRVGTSDSHSQPIGGEFMKCSNERAQRSRNNDNAEVSNHRPELGRNAHFAGEEKADGGGRSDRMNRDYNRSEHGRNHGTRFNENQPNQNSNQSRRNFSRDNPHSANDVISNQKRSDVASSSNKLFKDGRQ